MKQRPPMLFGLFCDSFNIYLYGDDRLPLILNTKILEATLSYIYVIYMLLNASNEPILFVNLINRYSDLSKN